MKPISKRLFSLLLAVIVVLGLPFTAMAATEPDSSQASGDLPLEWQIISDNLPDPIPGYDPHDPDNPYTYGVPVDTFYPIEEIDPYAVAPAALDQSYIPEEMRDNAMDKHRDNPRDIGAKAKAEKYAKILAKTIINPEGDNTDRGQNAYFYDSAEGLLASVVLLLSEFLPPEAAGGYELRHIASVFKLVQELLMESSSRRGGNQFQELMQLLPADHKAKWLAGSALTASDQGMNSIMSTVLSKLNAFLDTELEQVICFDGGIDAELFVRERCAIFLILPEEDATKNFVASLMIQNLARELFSVANEHGGRLPNRAVFFCDELGTMPPFDILPLFSAGRSRRLTLVPIIQSLAQLEKNYGKEGSEILCDNCQDTIFGGFAPNSQTAAALSENLGSRTVLSGTVTKGRNDDSQSLQMMERPLMSPDELKSMPKGSFVVMKTGTHPMRTKLKLFYDWGIRFEKPLEMPDRGSRPVHYAGKAELEKAILQAYPAIHTLPVAESAPTTGLNVKSMPNGVGIKTTL